MKTKIVLPLLAIPVAGVLLSSSLQAAVSYTGASYTQDFNSLGSSPTGAQPAWSNGSTLDSWYWADPDGFTAATYTVINRNPGTDSGLANQQDRPLSIGEYTTDRAFGTQSRSDNSDTTSDFARFGLQLTNDTGATLTEFTLSFTAEQWRAIGGQAADQLTFDYQVFSSGGSLTAPSGWTDVDAFTFEAPQTVGSSAWLDGNDSANQEVFSETITGINWGAGEELWLRWNDVSTLHAMMGIDDLTFTAAVPESSSYALLMGLSVGALLVTRRRRS
jgi:hypothetical protein